MNKLIVGLSLVVASVAWSKPQKPAISMDIARKTALARVEGGSIKSAELEKEHGKLIYSFELVAPNTKGIVEVNVDAETGQVLGVEHESR